MNLDLHDETKQRLAGIDQRYTVGRRTIVETLAGAGRPLTVPEIVDAADKGLPASSAYRNVLVLVEAGVAHRIVSTDDHARFELAEAFADHHHHLVCDSCGTVVDVPAAAALEQVVSETAKAISRKTGFRVTSHRVDLVGQCASCH